jgi:hypothetical protein
MDGTAGSPAGTSDGEDLGSEIFGVPNLTRGLATTERANTEPELWNTIVHRAPPLVGVTMHENRPQMLDGEGRGLTVEDG